MTNIPLPCIYVVGGGAIGQALAVILSQQSRRVVMVRATATDVPHTTKYTVQLSDDTTREASIKTITLADLQPADGIVVLTTKSPGNPTIAQRLADVARQVPVIILQNGLGVEQPFLDLGYTQLYRGVLFSTAQTTAATVARFKPVTASPIGVVRGDAAMCQTLVETLHTDLFPFVTSTDITTVAWRKTITNCVFNAVCPLLEVDNGIFHRDARAQEIAQIITEECLVVAQAHGIHLDAADIMDNILRISRASDGQWISTLQDIRQGRATEIDTLNVAIARLADDAGLGDRVPTTRMLGELIRLKSALPR